MHLRDYLSGKLFRLHSPLAARTIARQINKAAGSALWPFATGVVGGVWSGHVRLRYRSSLFEYNAKPVLAGRLKETPSGSNLNLRYRAPAWVYVFYLVWYLIIVLLIIGLLTNGWFRQVAGGDKAMIISIFAVLLIAPVALNALGTRRSDEELADMLEFLAQHAMANA